MKKSILNVGEALDKAQQKQINGGGRPCSATCYWSSWFVGDYCRTENCQAAFCNTQGNCEIGG